MISKERELLKKVWEDLDGDRDNYNMLCEEIEELLAQTEQPKPLSLEDIRVIINQLPTEVDLDTGIEFCRIIEKAHGIPRHGRTCRTRQGL